MKVVILAGGLGTRISEESHLIPKPMIEIGEFPIMVHIMKMYAAYGYNEFIICAGYKQKVIKEYFSNYFLYNSDITFDLKSNKKTINKSASDDWKVTVVDTGLHTQTGGRLKKIQEYIGDETFMLAYGDGVGDINVDALVKHHKDSGKLGTVTVYNFGQSKGVLDLDEEGNVKAFREKADMDGDVINIGYMVLEPKIFNFISGDDIPLEQEPLHGLVDMNELNSYTHSGFWQCMDTLREKEKLEKLWNSGKAPWKVWKN